MVASNRRINLIEAQDDNYIDRLIQANPEDEMMIRKAREMVTRQKSRAIISDYLCEEVKEEVSNSLLKDSDSLGKDEGIYTEVQINWQNKRRDALLNEDCIPQKEVNLLDGIAWNSIRIILKESNCNRRATECLELSLMGYSYRDIANKKQMVDKQGKQLSPMTIQRDVKCALNVLRFSQTVGLVELLCEVFHLSRSVVIDILRN